MLLECAVAVTVIDCHSHLHTNIKRIYRVLSFKTVRFFIIQKPVYHSSSEVARVSCRFQLKFENHGKTKYTQIIIRTLSQVKWQSHKYHIYIQIGTAFGTGKRKTENQFGGILCECARFNNKNTTRQKKNQNHWTFGWNVLIEKREKIYTCSWKLKQITICLKNLLFYKKSKQHCAQLWIAIRSICVWPYMV